MNQATLPGLDQAADQETTWRRLLGLRITRRTHPSGVLVYKAYPATQLENRVGSEHATFVLNARDHLRSGHIDGDFSQVQGQDAPCQTVSDWLTALTTPRRHAKRARHPQEGIT